MKTLAIIWLALNMVAGQLYSAATTLPGIKDKARAVGHMIGAMLSITLTVLSIIILAKT